MIASSANRFLTFKEKTAFMLDAVTITSTPVANRALKMSSYLQVNISGGTDGSGSVVINGTSPSGSAQNETLTFTGNGVQVTVNRWKEGTTPTFSTTGFTDEATVATISVESVDASGQPQTQEVIVAASRPCIDGNVGTTGGAIYPAVTPGTHELRRNFVDLDYEETWQPKVGYIASDDETGEIYTVDAVRSIRIGHGYYNSHWRLILRKLDV